MGDTTRLYELIDEVDGLLDEMRVEAEHLSNGTVIRVKPGDDVQAALDTLLPTGGELHCFPGPYQIGLTLPERPPNAPPIIIASDTALDEGRIDREAHLATFTGLTGKNRSRRVQCIGLAFDTGTGNPARTLVALGGDKTNMLTVEDQPEEFTFDRCRWTGHPERGIRRGLRLHARHVAVTRSAFYDCFQIGSEGVALAAWNGGQDVRVDNSYLAGGSQSLFLGGADPACDALQPEGWTITNSLFDKDPAWAALPAVPVRKFHFEIKCGRKVLVEDCQFERYGGSGLMLKCSNQEGSAPYTVVEDITIRRAIIRDAGYAFAFVAKCDAAVGDRADYHTERMRRILVEDCVGLRIGSNPTYTGRHRFLYVVDTPECLCVRHNTVIVAPVVHSWFEGTVNYHNDEGELPAMPSDPQTFEFHHNVALDGEYTAFGLDQVFPEAGRDIHHNVFGQGTRPTYPGGVTIPEADVRASIDANGRVIAGSPVAVAAADFPEQIGARI